MSLQLRMPQRRDIAADKRYATVHGIRVLAIGIDIVPCTDLDASPLETIAQSTNTTKKVYSHNGVTVGCRP